MSSSSGPSLARCTTTFIMTAIAAIALDPSRPYSRRHQRPVAAPRHGRLPIPRGESSVSGLAGPVDGMRSLRVARRPNPGREVLP